MVRTYGFPGCFTRPTGDLDSQLTSRNVHVEACRPREDFLILVATIGSVESSQLTPEPRPYSPPSYTPEPTRRPPFWKRAGGPLAALAAFAAKFKGLLLLLPKLKLLTTSGTMLVSVAAYALIWGWRFAIGFVALLFVHEMGHVIQLRREGIKAGAPLFIPFLGAVVGMKKMPEDAAAEARVGLAGPVLGSLACLVPLGIYEAGGS